MWLARDRCGALSLYKFDKPLRNEKSGIFYNPKDSRNGNKTVLSWNMFPQVTWENSPCEAELIVKL